MRPARILRGQPPLRVFTGSVDANPANHLRGFGARAEDAGITSNEVTPNEGQSRQVARGEALRGTGALAYTRSSRLSFFGSSALREDPMHTRVMEPRTRLSTGESTTF